MERSIAHAASQPRTPKRNLQLVGRGQPTDGWTWPILNHHRQIFTIFTRQITIQFRNLGDFYPENVMDFENFAPMYPLDHQMPHHISGGPPMASKRSTN